MKEIIINKHNPLKFICCSLLIVALMSGTAFASAGQPGSDNGNPVTPTISQEAENVSKNVLVSGKVTSITEAEDYCTISITNDDMGMIFHVGKGVFVIDKKTCALMSITDIKKGLEITAVIGKASPMTMSLPPQTSGAIGFIINSSEGSADLSTYNEKLVNFENTLQLNIGETSSIIDRKGVKKAFTAEDIKGSECLVLYTFSTRSIPAQTTPELVMILDSGGKKNDGSFGNVTYVHLRPAAEAKGFHVNWDPSKHTIILTKEDSKVEIEIGKSELKFQHKTKDIKPLDGLQKLDAIVKLENGKTMVPATFIDAL